jgi:hypothetical protein
MAMESSAMPSESVQAELLYVTPASTDNRRFVAPSGERHTGEYTAHPVTVRNARTAGERFSLDVHGFTLVEQPTGVDFRNRVEIASVYTRECEKLLAALTGADLVLTAHWNFRSSGPIRAEHTYPPSSDVHLDFTPSAAERLARKVYDEMRPGGAPYSRFIFFGTWRPITPPPQDWPFALCDARTFPRGDGRAKPIVVVDTLPEGDALYAAIPNVAELVATTVMPYDARHEWWYFRDMTPSEVVVLKHHDSDASVAFRVPHAAFRDPTVSNAVPRESIELRAAAYFL